VEMKNFKSWEDTGKIQLAPLTGFFGTNSSGKTSLLQLLILLKQTSQSYDRTQLLRTGSADQEDSVYVGLLPELVHRGAQEITLGVSWEMEKPIRIGIEKKALDLKQLSFMTRIHAVDEDSYVQEFRYSADNKFDAGMIRREDKSYGVYVHLNGKEPKRTWSRPLKDVNQPFKSYGFSAEALNSYQDSEYLRDLVLRFEQLFERVYYLGPLREYPKPFYTWVGEEPADVGLKGQQAVPALLKRGHNEKLWKGKGAPTLQEQVAYWLKQMGLVDAFRTVRIGNSTQYEVRIKRTANSPEVRITDVGFGISQVLPVLVQCYYCPEGSTLIFEQPEIHLHPSVQSVLADVFIHAIQKRKVQIIVESHSEHLLRRLQRRIAETEITNRDTTLYFCDLDDNGVSRIKPLEIDLFGNIRNWPVGFFGDLTGDMFEMAQAGIKRQMER